jgi:hypothetical protein
MKRAKDRQPSSRRPQRADCQRPIAKIVPFTVDDDDADDAALVAAGLMRKGSGMIPPSFWKARRSRMTVQAAAADREDD